MRAGCKMAPNKLNVTNYCSRFFVFCYICAGYAITFYVDNSAVCLHLTQMRRWGDMLTFINAYAYTVLLQMRWAKSFLADTRISFLRSLYNIRITKNSDALRSLNCYCYGYSRKGICNSVFWFLFKAFHHCCHLFWACWTYFTSWYTAPTVYVLKCIL